MSAYTIVTAAASSTDGTYDGLDSMNVAATNNDYETLYAHRHLAVTLRVL